MQENLLTALELSQKLKVPLSWVYARSGEAGIPKIKVGKYLRFNLDEVMQWLEKKEYEIKH